MRRSSACENGRQAAEQLSVPQDALRDDQGEQQQDLAQVAGQEHWRHLQWDGLQCRMAKEPWGAALSCTAVWWN